MENRRKIHKLLLFHQLQSRSLLIPFYIKSILPDTRETQTGINLRNSNTLTQPFNRTSLLENSFIPSTTRFWNNLPLSVHQSNSSAYKRLIYEHFGPSNPPEYFTFGSKHNNSLHTRLRLRASKLNADLNRLKLINSSACQCAFRNR